MYFVKLLPPWYDLIISRPMLNNFHINFTRKIGPPPPPEKHFLEKCPPFQLVETQIYMKNNFLARYCTFSERGFI